DDGVMIDISPGVYGNNSLNDPPADYQIPSIYDGHGHAENPITHQPYASNLVKRGDYVRALSEFWADGPTSETPPGHWNVVANDVADSPFLVKKIGGTGPIVDDLEWDVKMYLALNAATHDAACACWATKRYYDGWRPMSAIRYLGGLGQSSDPNAASYNAQGLTLIPNVIELVTPDSVTSGRHAGCTPGKIAVLGWPGETPQRTAPNGVHFLDVDTWTTYQRSNFVVPAFPGYFSGHSTFSRSAAEVLTALTDSEFFPGGETTYTISKLVNELGPTQPVPLTYATYYDAADGAGLSRIYGGIHPNADNLAGRRVGAQVGKAVWSLVKRYWDGSITNTPVTITRLNATDYEVRYQALRGFYYDLESSSDLNQPFANDPPGTSQPFDSLSVARTNTFSGPQKFHRAVSRSTP
ncbi:MAG TPA: vanadium-dependent haloperoxidase, partial [Candidatus Dormibacteraeota bacterium]|nr:vanadium-dependent haloperoxidase [Candidatus Dormibacteraeota bacterium]